MCVHVHSLPDECLLPIFDLIPLLELLHLDQVCPRWGSLLSSACARRHTLVLILGGEPIDEMDFQIPFNSNFEVSFAGHRPFYDLPLAEREASLSLPSLCSRVVESYSAVSFDEFLLEDDDDKSDDDDGGFFDLLYQTDYTEMGRIRTARHTDQSADYFINLFPNVHNLVVIHDRCYEEELRSMIDFVGSPSWSLRTLKLWFRTRAIDDRYVDRAEEHPFGALLGSINRQSSLHQLTLDVYSWNININPQFTFPAESYTFLTQLTVAKLHLGWYDRGNVFWATVNQLDSTKLSHIELGNCDWSPLDTALNVSYRFTPKVRQLFSYWLIEERQQLTDFCGRFCALTHLGLHWPDNFTFGQLVGYLASLKQLTHLKLSAVLGSHPENAFALDDQVDSNKQEQPCLSQVKILELVPLTKRSHDDFESLASAVFPSVQVISLMHYTPQCVKCVRKDGEKEFDMWTRCHRLLVRSLASRFASSSVRLYAKQPYITPYVDWTNLVNEQQSDADLM